jgi:hypothetical protein
VLIAGEQALCPEPRQKGEARMFSSHKFLSAACFAGAVCSIHGAAAASNYSAVHNFSVKANPNGPWTYEDSNGPLQHRKRHAGGIKGVNYWTDDNAEPKAVLVLGNHSGAPVDFDGGAVVVPTDHLLLDGQDDPVGARVRFTAPAAGVYVVRGDFEALNMYEHAHTVHIDQNGTSIYISTIKSDSYGKPHHFRLTVTLAAGDTLDFVSVEKNGDWTYLGTGLRALIAGP